ncbi:alpha/beta hydrolase domain-containing protein [Herbaspirillum chlorophenolicum]|uniref:alpha/beta hydrolase domain-containing protein n=1 Tax=Herbaspirillum chlorophenolicum TaxID=211589 RepID=UPI000AD1D78A|nr:alpha/beta hydrolase domain-containing protein [Herbaspirillum chlorophenolicum]
MSYATLFFAVLASSVAVGAAARVTEIKIDKVERISEGPQAYEKILGRAFGTLDPKDRRNKDITDISLGLGADGMLHYEAKFTLVKPVDMKVSSGFLWHDVPNRGEAASPGGLETDAGDMMLWSGWQGDNAGLTAIPKDRTTGLTHWVALPMARVDGALVTGKVMARIVNQEGKDSKPLIVHRFPVPYPPATLDTAAAVMKTHLRETVRGEVTEGPDIPSSDWAFAKCDANHPFPGRPIDITPGKADLPVQICMKNGFDPKLVYQLVYPATGAYVLGAGMAAFRDVGSFFKYATKDDAGVANPVAGAVRGSAIRGVSQSGNMLRQFIFMGMNEDEKGRKVYDGAWARIAGRRVSINSRFAQPDGTLELYMMGSEGPQWWTEWDDAVRGLPKKSIFTRCEKNGTCPKVFESFGSAEVYALKMTPEWVGTDAKSDIPLPANVRRYYIASTTHGGNNGGFNWQPTTSAQPTCPGNNFGKGTLAENPIAHIEMENVLKVAMRSWVLNNTQPPASRYPTIKDGNLVIASKENIGFPSNIPGIPDTIFSPDNFIFPILDYNWGPQFDHSEASGIPTNLPPPIKSVIPMMAPRVDADGNEIGGVPTVLAMAPLGTYLGWNITAGGFHAGQICNYIGGYVPFAKTKEQRTATRDPRLSLEERYKDHAGYVKVVIEAANKAYAEGYLLGIDRDRLIREARDSQVLR